MKKILASVLTAAMMLSMGTAVWADDTAVTGSITEARFSYDTDRNDDTFIDDYISVKYTISDGSVGYRLVLWSGDEMLITATPMAECGDERHVDNKDHLVENVEISTSCKFEIEGGESDHWIYNKINYPAVDVVPTKATIQITDANGAWTDVGSIALAISAEEWENALEDADRDNGVTGQEVTITKIYKENVAAAKNPAETFTFTVTEFEDVSLGVTGNDEAEYPNNADGTPALPTIAPIVAGEGEAEVNGKEYTAVVSLPEYTEVGVYKYHFKENQGVVTETEGVYSPTAGVTYYDKEMTLVVTVIQDQSGKIRVAAVHCEEYTADSPSYVENSTKTDVFENLYEAGEISITKALEGNMAETDQYFTVVVELTAPEGETVRSDMTYDITVASGDTKHEENPADIVMGVNTFYIKGGETINLANIPEGVTYTVYEVEAGQNEYKTKYDIDGVVTENVKNEEGATTITKMKGIVCEDIDGACDVEDVITITNSKDSEIDTGISVDSIPYIAMLGVVAIGGTGFIVSKKRRSED